MAERARDPWSLRRSLAVIGVVAGVLALLMITAGTYRLVVLSTARERVVDTIDPAYRQVEQLTVALVNQETGVRGYALGGSEVFVEPYRQGRREEDRATAALRRIASADPGLGIGDDLEQAVVRAQRWRTEYAEPVLARGGRAVPPERGKQLFDELRVPLGGVQGDLDRATVAARADLAESAGRLQWVFGILAAGLVVLLVVLALGLRRVVVGPVSALAAEVRRVSEGDFGSAVQTSGPREFVALGKDVDTMRRHIVDELEALREASDQLDQQAKELERSNTELEQFAYVASHDLQEPLRKVASFTQLLERRYKGQLDERADQYIAFAVDGAKRMQVLINDLLAFSRVGRLTREHAEINGNALVSQALGNLSLVLEESGAEVTVDDLPRISGDLSLLAGVIQNLVGNAVKFRGDEPPRIHIGVRDAGDEWEFCVADNGIGISPEYAERIFVIFQRLHAKDAYPGTGIGLAMARKIIEYHGGRIWLDTEAPSGTTFRFTLPKLAADSATSPEDVEPADGAVAEEPERIP